MKLAINIISNPDAGDEVSLAFIGTGTRWPDRISQLDHPGNALYNELRPLVIGASRSCSARWGTTESNQKLGLTLLDDNKVRGSVCGISLRRLLEEGWQTLIF